MNRQFAKLWGEIERTRKGWYNVWDERGGKPMQCLSLKVQGKEWLSARERTKVFRVGPFARSCGIG